MSPRTATSKRSNPARARAKAPALHVAMASSEIAPFARTGGLGDVLGSLPPALERAGVRVSLIMPAYRSVLKGDHKLEETGIRFSVPVSDRIEEAEVLTAKIGKAVRVSFIRNDRYFDRDNLYFGPEGDYADNAERFIFFSRAVLEVLRNEPPDVLHAHDWQTALAIVFLETQPELYPELAGVRTVFSVHNLGYQGLFWKYDWHLLNLDWRFFTPQYLEFYDKINFLKGGVVFADRVATVSPRYAEEIKTPEYGFGLDGVFRDRDKDLAGILNGLDYKLWNPETDTIIARTYSSDDLSGKAECKAELQNMMGLPVKADAPLVGMVTRLTSQKGCDLLERVLPDLMGRDVQFAMLGSGEQTYMDIFGAMPERYPGRVAVHIGFDGTFVHKVIAGADMLLIPSRYEPCGLTQMQSLRYGTPPVVRATGGLADTIKEFDPSELTGNGFIFSPYEAPDLLQAVDRALLVYHSEPDWRILQENAMKADFSWERSAKLYRELYQGLLAETTMEKRVSGNYPY